MGTIKRSTKNYNMHIPVFDAPGWGREVERNTDIIDAVMFAITGFTGVVGIWTNGTTYEVGDRVVDETDGTIYIAHVEHVSAASGTFADDRVAKPTYWTLSSAIGANRGAWTTATLYGSNEYVIDGYRVGVVRVNYVSGASYDADVASTNITTLVDLTAWVNEINADVTAADNSATASATSAGQSAASAAAALVSENNADASEAAALASKNAAAVSETNSANSAAASQASAVVSGSEADDAEAARVAAVAAQVAAESARDQTFAAYDNFDDRYLGEKAVDPTVDNDGDPLVGGALYFNTVAEIMKTWTGSMWVAAYVSGDSALLKANNLSDLPDAATARNNLGLGNAATKDVGAVAGSVAAGDDARFTSAVSDGRMPTRLGTTALSIPDWNLATSNGWYRSTAAAANIPSADAYVGLVERGSTNITQTIHAYMLSGPADSNVWRRHYDGATWGAWYRLQLSQGEQDARYLVPAIADSRLPTRLGITAAVITDWNVATANGWFMGSNLASAPTLDWYIGHVQNHGAAGYCVQTIVGFTTAAAANTVAYRRNQIGGVWGAWYKLQISQAEQDARYAQLAAANVFTLDQQITKAFPSFLLSYPAVATWKTFIDAAAVMCFLRTDDNDLKVAFGPTGSIWTKELGDLNTRIETRASAYSALRAAINPATSDTEVNFPVGTILYCEGPYTNNSRNASVTLRTYQVGGSTIVKGYQIGGASGSALSGTWRTCGNIINDAGNRTSVLAQRIA